MVSVDIYHRLFLLFSGFRPTVFFSNRHISFENVWLSVCLPLYWLVNLSVFLFIYLFIYLFISIHGLYSLDYTYEETSASGDLMEYQFR